MKTRIHVNQHIIKSNRLTGAVEPCLSVMTYKGTTQAHEVVIDGPSKMIYRPDKPLSCGARVWLETDSVVTCVVHEVEEVT